jgi:prepilin-type processing-associated H-X9-DG protein
MVYILPYVEQDAIYRKWQFKGQSGAFNSVDNAAAKGAVIPTWFCPSSPLTHGPSTSQANACTANYVAITGANTGLIPGYTETRINTLPCGGQISGGGALVPNGQIRFADIIDGTSNTICISEQSNFITDTSGVKQDWRASQPWGWYLGVKSPNPPPNFDNGGGDNREPNCTTIRYQINYTPSGGWANNIGATGVGLSGNCIGSNIPLNSTHTGGVNAVFGDGSVKFIANSTPLAVLAELATRDDGNVLPDY